jgi:hypothetical protein
MTRTFQIVAVAVAAIYLGIVAALIVWEKTFVAKEPGSPQAYFLYGSTGTELLPLPVFQVLPDLFPDQFQPAGKAAGDWITQFGFVRGQEGVNEGLPLGFSVSNYRPQSGAPSPVPFVGFNCAMCHTAKIRRSDGDNGVLVYGMGNGSLDLVAFGDAIKTSLLDPRLTTGAIATAYENQYHKPLGLVDKAMITVWLSGARSAVAETLALRGWPYGGIALRDSQLFTSGPGRNQPMRETVRFLIQQTPAPDGGASKIPCLYEQAERQWAQFDGSVRDPLTRNSLAALGVGASIQNLRVPGILNTLRQAYVYVSALEGPKYSEVFPSDAIDAARVPRGQAAYQRYCSDCHGSPGPKPGAWVKGTRLGKVVPATEVGTDPARVSFRFYDQMAQLIYNFIPDGHPLKPQRSDLRPNPGDPHGYITGTLESVFSRAPYLHNGSVATLAELINLKPRRTVLYRGSNLFDPVDVGLLIPNQPDSQRYFLYDTRVYGNSNLGHDYPWTYRGKGWDEDTLKDLLEYLKSI